jgi:hypothetical protein
MAPLNDMLGYLVKYPIVLQKKTGAMAGSLVVVSREPGFPGSPVRH